MSFVDDLNISELRQGRAISGFIDDLGLATERPLPGIGSVPGVSSVQKRTPSELPGLTDSKEAFQNARKRLGIAQAAATEKQREKGPPSVVDTLRNNLSEGIRASSAESEMYAPENLQIYKEYAQTPTRPPEDVKDFIMRVGPESTAKLPYALASGVLGMVLNPETEKAYEAIKRGDLAAAGGYGLQNTKNIIEGVARFTGEPLGLFGWDRFKERWTTDPAGSIAGILPVAKLGRRAATKAIDRQFRPLKNSAESINPELKEGRYPRADIYEKYARNAVYQGRPISDKFLKNPEYLQGIRQEFIELDGSPDMGSIGVETAKESGIQSAPIRIQFGDETYGAIHVAAKKEGKRLQSFKEAGYMGIPDFVKDIAQNYNQIWKQPNGRLMLVKRNGGAKVAVIELSKEGDYYGVTTSLIADKGYPARGGRELLWERREPVSASPE